MKTILLLFLTLTYPLAAQTAWIIYDAAGQLVPNPSGGTVFATNASAGAVVDCGFVVVRVDLSATPITRTTIPLQCVLPTSGGASGSTLPAGTPPTGGFNGLPAAGQIVLSGGTNISGIIASDSNGSPAAALLSTLSEVCDGVSVPNPDVSLQEAFGDGFTCYFKASPADRTN